MNQLRLITFLCTALLLAACSNNAPNMSLYHWGNYNKDIYNYYEQQGNFDEQENEIIQIINTSNAQGKKVAPGIYAHLGLLQLKQSKNAQAQASFAKEQQLYPESARFMQFLQKNKSTSMIKNNK